MKPEQKINETKLPFNRRRSPVRI